MSRIIRIGIMQINSPCSRACCIWIFHKIDQIILCQNMIANQTPRFSFSNSFAIASTISGCISPQNLRVMWMVFGATHLIPAPAAFFAASHSPRASMCSGGSFTQMNVRRSLPASGGIQLPIISCLRRAHLRRRIFLSGRQGPVQRSAGGRPPCLLQIGGETPPCRSLS